MSLSKTIILTAVIISFCMTLFPPWLVRNKYGDSRPAYAGGYAFIASPPDREYRPPDDNGFRGYDSMVATLDADRLTFQLLAVALLTGGVVVALNWRAGGCRDQRQNVAAVATDIRAQPQPTSE